MTRTGDARNELISEMVRGRLYSPSRLPGWAWDVVRLASGFVAVGASLLVLTRKHGLQDARLVVVAGAVLQALIVWIAHHGRHRWVRRAVTVSRGSDGALLIEGRGGWMGPRKEAVRMLSVTEAGDKWIASLLLVESGEPALLELERPPPARFVDPPSSRIEARVAVRSPDAWAPRALGQSAPMFGALLWSLTYPADYYNFVWLCLMVPLLFWIAVWGLFDFGNGWVLSARSSGIYFGPIDKASWEEAPRLADDGRSLFVFWPGGERDIDVSSMRLPAGYALFLLSSLFERARGAAVVTVTKARSATRRKRRKAL